MAAMFLRLKSLVSAKSGRVDRDIKADPADALRRPRAPISHAASMPQPMYDQEAVPIDDSNSVSQAMGLTNISFHMVYAVLSRYEGKAGMVWVIVLMVYAAPANAVDWPGP